MVERSTKGLDEDLVRRTIRLVKQPISDILNLESSYYLDKVTKVEESISACSGKGIVLCFDYIVIPIITVIHLNIKRLEPVSSISETEKVNKTRENKYSLEIVCTATEKLIDCLEIIMLKIQDESSKISSNRLTTIFFDILNPILVVLQKKEFAKNERVIAGCLRILHINFLLFWNAWIPDESNKVTPQIVIPIIVHNLVAISAPNYRLKDSTYLKSSTNKHLRLLALNILFDIPRLVNNSKILYEVFPGTVQAFGIEILKEKINFYSEEIMSQLIYCLKQWIEWTLISIRSTNFTPINGDMSKYIEDEKWLKQATINTGIILRSIILRNTLDINVNSSQNICCNYELTLYPPNVRIAFINLANCCLTSAFNAFKEYSESTLKLCMNFLISATLDRDRDTRDAADSYFKDQLEFFSNTTQSVYLQNYLSTDLYTDLHNFLNSYYRECIQLGNSKEASLGNLSLEITKTLGIISLKNEKLGIGPTTIFYDDNLLLIIQRLFIISYQEYTQNNSTKKLLMDNRKVLLSTFSSTIVLDENFLIDYGEFELLGFSDMFLSDKNLNKNKFGEINYLNLSRDIDISGILDTILAYFSIISPVGDTTRDIQDSKSQATLLWNISTHLLLYTSNEIIEMDFINTLIDKLSKNSKIGNKLESTCIILASIYKFLDNILNKLDYCNSLSTNYHKDEKQLSIILYTWLDEILDILKNNNISINCSKTRELTQLKKSLCLLIIGCVIQLSNKLDTFRKDIRNIAIKVIVPLLQNYGSKYYVESLCALDALNKLATGLDIYKENTSTICIILESYCDIIVDSLHLILKEEFKEETSQLFLVVLSHCSVDFVLQIDDIILEMCESTFTKNVWVYHCFALISQVLSMKIHNDRKISFELWTNSCEHKFRVFFDDINNSLAHESKYLQKSLTSVNYDIVISLLSSQFDNQLSNQTKPNLISSDISDDILNTFKTSNLLYLQSKLENIYITRGDNHKYISPPSKEENPISNNYYGFLNEDQNNKYEAYRNIAQMILLQIRYDATNTNFDKHYINRRQYYSLYTILHSLIILSSNTKSLLPCIHEVWSYIIAPWISLASSGFYTSKEYNETLSIKLRELLLVNAIIKRLILFGGSFVTKRVEEHLLIHILNFIKNILHNRGKTYFLDDKDAIQNIPLYKLGISTMELLQIITFNYHHSNIPLTVSFNILYTLLSVALDSLSIYLSDNWKIVGFRILINLYRLNPSFVMTIVKVRIKDQENHLNLQNIFLNFFTDPKNPLLQRYYQYFFLHNNARLPSTLHESINMKHISSVLQS
ncbi:uncharacterized protein CMU_000820 [Cryptosporidium muris RN66]|uniref:Uncharacterized protein n=1 Tax=Cryptosporidium muris (strain RN66) TaxID=441375 RepID=B6AG71_CRYMR|nr:uncharacterized protein CMU_000820 [Cryptosporidium muris RN66]EEA07212.1 hypothetical protein CMU_000820 [Cryptosporidium muris RN66]|eukprot:XP_002141561.1 hypothetical protein [Cryptosporidium muris RN66]